MSELHQAAQTAQFCSHPAAPTPPAPMDQEPARAPEASASLLVGAPLLYPQVEGVQQLQGDQGRGLALLEGGPLACPLVLGVVAEKE